MTYFGFCRELSVPPSINKSAPAGLEVGVIGAFMKLNKSLLKLSPALRIGLMNTLPVYNGIFRAIHNVANASSLIFESKYTSTLLGIITLTRFR